MIMSGELAGEGLVSVGRAEENPWSPIILRQWKRRNSSDMVGGNTGTGAGVNRE